MSIQIVVEGASDVGAAMRLVEHAGLTPGRHFVKGGKALLDRDLPKYNQAARHGPWLVLRDADAECPVDLRARLLASLHNPAPTLVLRVANSMTEAWLLADRSGFAEYFQISKAIIPSDPDSLPHAKREVVSLCGRSTDRTIRQKMTTLRGETGPEYVATINDFARSTWNVGAAAEVSPSLSRALKRLTELRGVAR